MAPRAVPTRFATTALASLARPGRRAAPAHHPIPARPGRRLVAPDSRVARQRVTRPTERRVRAEIAAAGRAPTRRTTTAHAELHAEFAPRARRVRIPPASSHSALRPSPLPAAPPSGPLVRAHFSANL